MGLRIRSTVSLFYFGPSITKFTTLFFFKKLTCKSPSYASSLDSLTGCQCIPSKCSLLQKNVRENQSVCVSCSLPSEEEIKKMKLDILASFQSSPNVVFKVVFLQEEFFWSNKCFRLSNCVSTKPHTLNLICFFGIRRDRISETEFVPIFNGALYTAHIGALYTSHTCLITSL